MKIIMHSNDWQQLEADCKRMTIEIEGESTFEMIELTGDVGVSMRCICGAIAVIPHASNMVDIVVVEDI